MSAADVEQVVTIEMSMSAASYAELTAELAENGNRILVTSGDHVGARLFFADNPVLKHTTIHRPQNPVIYV